MVYPNNIPNQLINNNQVTLGKNTVANGNTVLYPFITNNNITYNTVYNYNMPPQILNQSTTNSVNNVYNFQPVVKSQDKKKSFGKVLEAYAS